MDDKEGKPMDAADVPQSKEEPSIGVPQGGMHDPVHEASPEHPLPDDAPPSVDKPAGSEPEAMTTTNVDAESKPPVPAMNDIPTALNTQAEEPPVERDELKEKNIPKDVSPNAAESQKPADVSDSVPQSAPVPEQQSGTPSLASKPDENAVAEADGQEVTEPDTDSKLVAYSDSESSMSCQGSSLPPAEQKETLSAQLSEVVSGDERKVDSPPTITTTPADNTRTEAGEVTAAQSQSTTPVSESSEKEADEPSEMPSQVELKEAAQASDADIPAADAQLVPGADLKTPVSDPEPDPDVTSEEEAPQMSDHVSNVNSQQSVEVQQTTQKSASPPVVDKEELQGKSPTMPDTDISQSVGGDCIVPDMEISQSVGGNTNIPDVDISQSVGGNINIPDVDISQSVGGDTNIPDMDVSQSVGGNTNIPDMDVSQSVGGDTNIPDVDVSQSVGGNTNIPDVDMAESMEQSTNMTKSVAQSSLITETVGEGTNVQSMDMSISAAGSTDSQEQSLSAATEFRGQLNQPPAAKAKPASKEVESDGPSPWCGVVPGHKIHRQDGEDTPDVSLSIPTAMDVEESDSYLPKSAGFDIADSEQTQDSNNPWNPAVEDSCSQLSRGDDGASQDGLSNMEPPRPPKAVSPVIAFSEDANMTMATGADDMMTTQPGESLTSLPKIAPPTGESQDSDSMTSVSMGETCSQTSTGKKRGRKRRRDSLTNTPSEGRQSRDDGSGGVQGGDLVEYAWPLKSKEIFMLQEQVAEFLRILSFKRKYPDIFRRQLFYEERIHLRDKGIVTEMQCDLGLTAVKSSEIHKLMKEDYPEKYAMFQAAVIARAKAEVEREQEKIMKYKAEKAAKDKERREQERERKAVEAAFLQLNEEGRIMSADKLVEYQWPADKNAEYYMLQEQISEYLGVLSFKRKYPGEYYMLQEKISEYLGVLFFKRKYPDLFRRPLEIDERDLLREKGLVSEMMCDLGLTALKSEEIMDLLQRDYPEKYKEYTDVLRERENEKLKQKQKELEMVGTVVGVGAAPKGDKATATAGPTIINSFKAKNDKAKMEELLKKAVRAAADFNMNFNRERREERRAYLDMQTSMIHYPKSQIKKLPAECTKAGSYPVSLIPGQYQDYCKRYTPQQLKYFPVNSALYSSPKKMQGIYADPGIDTETEKSSQADENSQSGSSSSSDSGDSSSESGTEAEEQASVVSEEVRAPTPVTTKRSKTAKLEVAAPVAMAKGPSSDSEICYMCKGTTEMNQVGEEEELVKCSECNRWGHPTCLELSEEMIPIIKTYPWQCMECKTCIQCMDPYDEDKMMFCDHCDRGYHTFCVGLRNIPTGRWECKSCRKDDPPKAKRGRAR